MIISKRTAQMIAAARACVGTPFHHQGRLAGVGLDCIGLVVIALRAAGVKIDDRLDYGVRPDGASLIKAIEDHGGHAVHGIEAGDVLVIRYDQQPQHVAIATSSDKMVHSFAPAGKVVETTIGPYWRRRIIGTYYFDLLDEE